MKVAPKLALVAWVAFLPVLAIHGCLSVRRQQELFWSDSERDLAVLGEYVREMAEAAWARGGEPEALALLKAAARDRHVRIRWKPGAGAEEARHLEELPDRLVWVEPVAIGGRTMGRIEVSESLAPARAFLRVTVLRIAVLSLALGGASVLAARLLGQGIVGRRLEMLVDYARRVGGGELGGELGIGGRDEISLLASSLSDMSGQLAEARGREEQANAQRIGLLHKLRHEDRLASIGRLSAGLAHELGTPLNVVMGHSDRISEGSLTAEELSRSAVVIRRQVQRMAATIRRVLDFVRSAPTPRVPVDLTRVLSSVCDLLAPLTRQRGVELVTTSSLPEAFVQGDEIQLEQALSNLVQNAVDATGPGGRVEIALERVADLGEAPRRGLAIHVCDQGPGLPEKDTERLFEPFFTSKPAGTGTGLGLWLTHGIVEDHGGRIEFADLPEGGARFTILLPEAST